MLKLYYTGAQTWKNSQTLASKSLGGYISNTSVPNGLTNSLFGDIGELDLWKKKPIKDYIGLALYFFAFSDQEQAEFKNFIFTLNYSLEEDISFFKDAFTFEIGLGPIGGNQTNGLYMEQIQDNAKPYYLEQDFKKLEEGTPVKFENVTSKGIGLWLCRTFNPLVAGKMFDCSSDYWIENDNLPNLSFDFDISIDWEDYIP